MLELYEEELRCNFEGQDISCLGSMKMPNSLMAEMTDSQTHEIYPSHVLLWVPTLNTYFSGRTVSKDDEYIRKML